MKKFLYILLGISLAIAGTAYAINITVPSAPTSGFILQSTTTGAYVATSTWPIYFGSVTATSTTMFSTFPKLNLGTTTAGCLQVGNTGITFSTGVSCGTGSGGGKWATSTLPDVGIFPNSASFVGIGTTTPRYLLQVSSSTAPQFVLTDGTNVGYAFRTAGGLFYLATTSATTFGTSTGTTLAIDANGDIGVASSSPHDKFTVAGNIWADGFITAYSTSTSATSTIGGGLIVGNNAILYDNTSGSTTIANLNSGTIVFDSNAGQQEVADIPVDANAPINQPQGLSFGYGGTTTLTSYAESAGNGNIQNIRLGVATSAPRFTVHIQDVRPQLSLWDTLGGANLKGWNLASEGGFFYVSTSSDGYATTTIPAFMSNANANFGIGTTTPWAKLSVMGKVGANTYEAVSNVASIFPYASTTSFNSSGATFLATAGDPVGIGTTTPWASLAVNPVAAEAANQFVVGSSTATNFIVKNSGFVGINNPDPLFNLHILSGVDPAAVAVEGVGNVGVNFVGLRANGTISSKTAATTNDTLFVLGARGYQGAAYTSNTAVVKMFAAEPYSGTNQGSYITFETTPIGSTATSRTERLRIGNNGFVGIGTSTPFSTLHVSAGASVSTTTVTIGELGAKASCVNMTTPNGGPASYYINNGGVMIVEANLCR